MGFKMRAQSQLFFHSCPQDSNNKGRLITDHSRGEILCQSCGLVLKERMLDAGQERPVVTVEDFMNKVRNGPATKLTIHDQGVSSKIGANDVDSNGKRLDSFNKNRFWRLRTWDSRCKKKSSKEQNTARAFTFLDSIKTKIGLSDAVVERAAYFYRKAVQKNLIRGRTVSGMMLACIYGACREYRTPRSLSQIAKIGNVRKKALQRDFRTLLRGLELKCQPHDPINFLNRVATDVGASQKSRLMAQEFLESAKKRGLATSKNPLSLSGAALYLSCGINSENISYPKLSKSTGISSVTLRKHVYLLTGKLQGEAYIDLASKFMR